jgi:hypothetical protein
VAPLSELSFWGPETKQRHIQLAQSSKRTQTAKRRDTTSLMSSHFRSGIGSRRPLPTISESPTSTSAQNPTNNAAGSSSHVRSTSAGSIPKLTPTRQSSHTPTLKPPLVKPRTSKTSQKHVDLPTAVQEAPLVVVLEPTERDAEADDSLRDDAEVVSPGHLLDTEEEDSRGTRKKSRTRGGRGEVDFEDTMWKRTIGEQLSPEQRDEMGYQRLTAYYCCEEFNMGLLSGFLKREHAVSPRSVGCCCDPVAC